MNTIRTLACSVVCLASSSLAYTQDQKLPEPDSTALQRAEGLIKGIYRTDYAKKFPSEMRELATKLINKALETRDDPAARFVLYREAAELAAKSGDFAGALMLIDELGSEFDADMGALKFRVLKAAAGSTPPVPPKLLCEAALYAMPDAFASNNPAITEDLIAIAAETAAKTKSPELQASVTARRAELKDVLQDFEKYRAALVTVQAKPQDPEANLIVGKYACFIKGDWKRGLTHLSQGSDPTLKALATRDLAKPVESAAQVELADAWWDVGELTAAHAKRQVLGRAAYWYSEASPRLGGLTLSKARDRVTKTYTQYPGLEPGSAAAASVFAPYAGLWELRYANTTFRRYLFDIHGNFYTLADSKVYRSRLIPSGEQMLLYRDRVTLEKFTVRDGELLGEHFHPPSRLTTTAIGKKKELPERKSGAAAATGNFRDISGNWLATQSDKSYRIYMFGPKGTGVFFTQDDAFVGTLTRKDDHIVFECNDDKICRIKPVAGGLRIDVFTPASTYPGSEPGVVATAVRLSR
jgi:hypothetical protein